MSWIRTSVSLISFGVSIYKCFDYLAKAEQVPVPHGAFEPHQFAILGLGLLRAVMLRL